ncbi:MAG: DUF2249 domain-containing protein [Pseudomonadota bacterium]
MNSNNGSVILDMRLIPPWDRHSTIFNTFDALSPGEFLLLVNDHDPAPLRYQFESEKAGEFAWEYVEQGPDSWQVHIAKK